MCILTKKVMKKNKLALNSIDEFCDLTYASAALVGKSDVDVLKVFKGEK